MHPFFPRARLLCLLAIVGGLIACSPTIDTRGHVPDPDALAQIKAGIQTRQDVTRLLGTPSAISTFDDTAWYYISSRTSQTAFFTPRVLEQNVVAIEFDPAGRVTDVRNYSLEDGQVIDPVTRKTPAPGKELTFLEQLVGNVGRFNTGSGRSGR